ncbi:hypothetical protein F8388_001856 [Cannabis sativa]|uniref:Uncharacterized protein n=1 Tax=Cannabis sativa TaxID=3483 RepID=A0A7J6FFF5_CANSA|nr:hypothetical protein F8388_001856 [Cannabis sativa]
MENFRSRSCRDGGGGSGMQMDVYYGNKAAPTIIRDLRCYSANYAGWSLNDPELQRKKRVVGYKAYVVEGKMKGSFRKSFKWIKRKKKKKKEEEEEEEEGAAGRAQRERE